MLVRVAGLILIVLGVLFWTDHALTLVPVHMLVGFVLVFSLWALAVVAARAGVHPGLVALAIGWGFIVPVLGLTQERLLPGDAHWVIQVLHLLVGLGAIGQAEGLAARIKGRRPTDQSAQHKLLWGDR
jgi:thiol:disulfide interchange protein